MPENSDEFQHEGESANESPETEAGHAPAAPASGVCDEASLPEDRRTFLTATSSLLMGGSLLAGYGTLAVMAGQFVYVSRPEKRAWVFVGDVAGLNVGGTWPYRTPNGQTVTITRKSASGTEDDFLALSSVCPHLGCRVHWEPQNDRFFCPCHNGVFDPDGKATAGPPGEAGQSLAHFPLRVDNGLLFMEVPVEQAE